MDEEVFLIFGIAALPAIGFGRYFLREFEIAAERRHFRLSTFIWVSAIAGVAAGRLEATATDPTDSLRCARELRDACRCRLRVRA